MRKEDDIEKLVMSLGIHFPCYRKTPGHTQEEAHIKRKRV